MLLPTSIPCMTNACDECGACVPVHFSMTDLSDSCVLFYLFYVLLNVSVVTDSEFASESANFSSVRPSPSPRIFGGRK